MIQLYKYDNQNFTKNGDVILTPIRCEVTAGINRTWQVDIEHPLDPKGRWKSIIENAVIKTPSFNGTQLWRIVQVSKSEGGVTAVCDPIFYDAAQEVFFMDKRVVDKTAQQAFDILCEGTRYSGYSDLTGIATAYYELVNLVEAIQNPDNGMVKRWGGEVGFDNYQVNLVSHIGEERGVVITYGKNIAANGLTESVDIDGVITRLIPQGYNGRLIRGVPYVDSPLIGNYATPRIGLINFENIRYYEDKQGDEEKSEGVTFYQTYEELEEALRQAAEEEFRNGLDKPKVNIEADVVLLENTEEYKDFKNLDEVSIGDEVTCRHERLGIDTKVRVIQLRYDCIKEKVVYVELGNRKRNYFDNVSSTINAASVAINPGGTVNGDMIRGFIDGALAQLRIQNTAAVKQEAIGMLFEDLDPESPTFGAMALGTQGLQIADRRTADGRDWVWSTFGTGKGFNAELITAGTLRAINIFGSIITGSTLRTEALYPFPPYEIYETTEISNGTLETEVIRRGEGSDIVLGQSRASVSATVGDTGFPEAGFTAEDYVSSTGEIHNKSRLDYSELNFETVRQSATQRYKTSYGRTQANIERTDNNTRTTISPAVIRVENGDNLYTSGTGIVITDTNIEIYSNGSVVWRARNI